MAFPLTQGAGAKATAYFNNTCGYTGEVYAHSKSKAAAADNSVTSPPKAIQLWYPTDRQQRQRRRRHHRQRREGVRSSAYASVLNYDLEITYAQSDQNFSCVASLPSPWAKADVARSGWPAARAMTAACSGDCGRHLPRGHR